MKETNKKLSAEEKILMEEELKSLLTKIDDRKRRYWILDMRVDKIPQQQQLFNDFRDRLLLPQNERTRFYLYYGWNGSWKTAISAYITALLAIWWDCEKYWLPYL